MRKLILLAALTGIPVVARAQTREALEAAKKLYAELQVERARDMFLQVVSPSSPYEVTTEQRVEAYKYLGAAQATLRKPDSARVYFIAAIERDPFVDLDPQAFTEQERQAFTEARRRVYRVGLRPLVTRADTLDPRQRQLNIRLFTTHQGSINLQVNSLVDEQLRFTVFQGETEGARDIPWNGTLPRGELIPPGPYELVMTGVSRVIGGIRDSTTVVFNVAHDLEALEDTLAPLTSDQMLPERHPSSLGARELLMGLGVGTAAFLIPQVMSDGDLGTRNRTLSAAVVGAGTLAGIAALIVRNSHPTIPENVAENVRRRAAWQQFNADVQSRNDQKLSRTRLIFTP